MALLDEVQAHVTALEAHLVALLPHTPYQAWVRLKGLSPVQVASLAAAIGDPAHYASAAQVFRRAGLVSGRNDSGTRQRHGKGQPLLKTGDVYLRRTLLFAIATLILPQPVLCRYYQKLKQSKPEGVARGATLRRALGILWATLRDQTSTTLMVCKGAEM